MKWQRQHGTMKFTAAHMNYILVEMWHFFQQQSASVIIEYCHISPCILKAGISANDQPKDNRPNLRLKRYYGRAKVKCQRQNGTMKFTAAHMNYILSHW